MRLTGLLSVLLPTVLLAGSDAFGQAARTEAACLFEFRVAVVPNPPGDSNVGRMIEDMHRYAILTDPSVPDYWIKTENPDRLTILFLSDCATSTRSLNQMTASDWREGSARDGIRLLATKPATRMDRRRGRFFVSRPKFWQRECIVGIKQTPTAERGDWDRFLEFSLYHVKENLDRFAPFSLNAGGSGPPQIFLYFWHSCDRRVEMARELVADYEQRFHRPRVFRVLEQRFEPSLNNVTIHGGDWLDKYIDPHPRDPISRETGRRK